jgi:hypothetical protein
MSSNVRVYCPNHGLIKTIEMDCMWKGRPPMPEIEDAFCPKCGERTKIVKSKPHRESYSWTSDDEKRYNGSDEQHFGMEIGEDGIVKRIIR